MPGKAKKTKASRPSKKPKQAGEETMEPEPDILDEEFDDDEDEEAEPFGDATMVESVTDKRGQKRKRDTIFSRLGSLEEKIDRMGCLMLRIFQLCEANVSLNKKVEILECKMNRIGLNIPEMYGSKHLGVTRDDEDENEDDQIAGPSRRTQLGDLINSPNRCVEDTDLALASFDESM